MKRAPSLTALLLAGVVGAALSVAGHAAGSDDGKRRATFRQGIAAMQAEKWDDALAIYQKLWDEERTYDVALSLGQVELNLKRYRDAAEHLDYGIRNLPPREDAAVSARSEHMLDLARREIGALRIHVDRANAEVSIDGKVVGTSPIQAPLFLEPGSHLVEANAAGSTPIRQMVSAVAGRESTLDLAFGEAPPSAAGDTPSSPSRAVTPVPPAEPAEPPPPEPDSNDGSSTARTVALVSGAAVTTIAAAVTITFALEGASAASDADDARARATSRFGQNPCSSAAGAASPECADLQNALDRRESRNRTANVALFVTAVAGISTATAFFLWPKDEGHRNRAVRLVPTFGRQAGGALLTGTF